jgi:lysophospholipase L1-like esterase
MPLEEVSKKLIINPFLIRYSYFYRFIILRIENYLEAKRKPTGIYMHQKEEGRYYMQFIQDMCRNNRISLFIVIFPYLKPLNKYEDYQKKDYESICRVVKETGVNYINLYEHLSEQELYNLREKKEDEIHPGRNGHILIGKIIYRYLLKIFSNDQ